MDDPWTWTTGWGLTMGAGGGWGWQKQWGKIVIEQQFKNIYKFSV